jgi:hypothetical protein
MNEQERQLVAAHLTAGRERLLGLVEGLTPAQWTFQPGEGRWSISQCLEHVTRVENRILGLIGKKLEEPPEPPKPPELTSEKDTVISKMVADRTNRRQAPEPALPTGQWGDPANLVAEFRKTSARTAQFVAEAGDGLRNHFLPHPAFGEIDCYQWLLVLGLHGVRHAQQIEEVQADPAFPARAEAR